MKYYICALYRLGPPEDRVSNQPIFAQSVTQAAILWRALAGSLADLAENPGYELRLRVLGETRLGNSNKNEQITKGHDNEKKTSNPDQD